jgi:hypothetical protein
LFYDNDVERRELYGKAGAYRPKPYGCEYRVLSNRWLTSSTLIGWVFRNTALALQKCATDFLPDRFGNIEEVINTSNREEAMRIIRDAGIPMPEVQ